jgi:MYXO-CTERM domain-containing protein
VCNGDEVCNAGACAGVAVTCDDGDACTDDRCVEPGGCAHDAVTDCCVADGECDDGDPCTDDACVASRCESAPIAGCGVDGGAAGIDAGADGGAPSLDGSVGLDSGADAGTEPTMEGGCGCRAAGASDRGAPSVLFLMGLVALRLARRRRLAV